MKTVCLLLAALACQHNCWTAIGTTEATDVKDIGCRVVVEPRHYHGDLLISVNYGKIFVRYGETYDPSEYTRFCPWGEYVFKTNGYYRCERVFERIKNKCLGCDTEYYTTNSYIRIAAAPELYKELLKQYEDMCSNCRDYEYCTTYAYGCDRKNRARAVLTKAGGAE